MVKQAAQPWKQKTGTETNHDKKLYTVDAIAIDKKKNTAIVLYNA